MKRFKPQTSAPNPRTQKGRDEILGLMVRAESRGDWETYNELKATLFKFS